MKKPPCQSFLVSRSALTATVLQILGVASIVVGGFLVWIPAGFILAGVGLLAFGLAIERAK